MDDRSNKRGAAMPFTVSRPGSYLVSGELTHEARSARYPIRSGNSTRVTAVKTIEDEEQGQSSKSNGRPSSSKPLSQKSVLPVPKLRSSSAAKSRKTYRVPSNSDASRQSSSMRNMSVGLGQMQNPGSIFQGGGTSSSSRLGLAEISNLTCSERSTYDLNFRQETPASSMSRHSFHSNSSMERREPRVTSSRYLNTLGSWNESELLKRQLSDLSYENEQEHVWKDTQENGATDTGAGPSTSSLTSDLMNDAQGHSEIFENNLRNNTDDSFATVSSMAGDSFDGDAVSSSDSALCSGSLLNQRSQEQGILRRGMSGQVDNHSASLGEEINTIRTAMSKQKNSLLRSGQQVAGRNFSEESFTTGSGPKERYGGRASVRSSRRNLGNLGCTSASDALPLNGSSFNGRCSEQPSNRRADPGRRTIDGRDSVRGQRMAKLSANNTGGPESQRVIRSEVGIGSHYQMTSTPRISRRTVHSVQPDSWCSQEFHGGDNVAESGLSSESHSRSMRVSDQNGMFGNRHRARSPSSTRGRSAFGALQKRNDVSHGAGRSLGETAASRLSAAARRGTSSSVPSAHFFGLAGPSSRHNSICSDSGSSSYSLLSEDEDGHRTSIVSSPAPSRAPPLPPTGQSVQSQSNSSFPMSLSFSAPLSSRAPLPLPFSGSASLSSSSGTDSISLFDGAAFGRSASGSNASIERPMVDQSENGGRRAFRALSIESHSHSQYTMEGLAEVLLALERIEQDEDFTYEHVWMLEANLLFGGNLQLHDQHRDMRLDIDNMSYEELLALEERIGSVSTGLTEDAISKCMKRALFASDVAVADLNSLESEVKCSVCQEEYEEGEELGRLNCDHSYHADCIKKWLVQKNQCPICKAPAFL
uniref:RING-type E3 ubiquitin transferase n=1 Tax=Wollemia nobilis TaxID=56998 RepID=A0A0C9S3S8_9CONI